MKNMYDQSKVHCTLKNKKRINIVVSEEIIMSACVNLKMN